MASLFSLSGFKALGAKCKEGKSRCKPALKPIFKKWSQSEKEKRSVDLDRAWDEQDEQRRSTQSWGGPLTPSCYNQAMTTGHDAVASGVAGGGAPGPAGDAGAGVHGSISGVQPYNHARSISGTSHVSVATSNSSNGMAAPRQTGGTFVHPFQQTPRTTTPPMLSYTNSLASIANVRDHSPTTITEDENDDEDTAVNSAIPNPNPPNHCVAAHCDSNKNGNDTGDSGNSRHNSPSIGGAYKPHTSTVETSGTNNHSLPTSQLKRPALATHRTSSSSYIPSLHSPNTSNPSPQPILRIKTTRTSPSIPVHSSRLANDSGSDLYLDRIVDSPTSSKLPGASLASPSSAITPMSPFRTSLDGGVSRLRAKSDLDTVTRAEHVRAARRKYEMKERAKEEKYAREEVKRRERADNKRAHELEKQLAAHHKEQLAAKAREEAAELEQALQRGKHNRKVSVTNSTRPSLSIPRPSLSLGRPSMSRKNTTPIVESEKLMTSSYDNTNTNTNTDPLHSPIRETEARTTRSVPISSPKRRNTAKKKTKSAWASFVLWLRTKLLRLGRH
ncbi:hypothetical protein GGS21DRAFT_488552 [Xylaria nigripes]|nr:hypothetical protein GGS21DRAFT_488552 [Xylaria nigripes]